MSNGTILIVEDDASLLAGIKDILQLEYFTPLTATNGEDALRILQNAADPPDLIVSDIMMPRMDGIAFLKKVREVDRFVSIPFIFLTALGERQDVQRGKELGVDDYVTKPFKADDLLLAIRSRLDRARDVERVQAGREDKLKKNILTILNHEFRTPLTFIVAYSDLLGDFPEEINGGGKTEMLTFLSGVQSGADRLRRLIENFITLVELETETAANNIQWRKKPCDDLQALLQDVAERTIKSLDGDYPYTVIITDVTSSRLVADEDYLKIAIAHLIDNACKFSSPDEQINITAGALDDEAYIAVRDNGRGIPAEEHDKIWQSFYQIDRAHYEDQGSGSGLAIVKGIVELHGGRVKVESTVGKGSTFTVYLPLTPQPLPDPQQA